VLAAVLLGGGDDGGGRAATTSTSTSPTSGPSKVGKLRPIATRPNGITIAKRRVWVLSGEDGQILLLDSERGALQRRIQIRSGGTAVAAGFDSVWALKGQTRSLLRFDTNTKRRIGATTKILVEGLPVSVATGEGAVWVGVRKKGRRDGSGESLVKIDPRLNPPGQEAIPIAGGVQDVAVGEGAVWVTTTFGQDVVRIDPHNLNKTRRIGVGRQLNGIAVGEGAVWVAGGADKSVTRINPRTFNRRSVSLGVVPTRVAVGGGSVWVTARDANRLFRVDPERLEVRERLDTGAEPFAIDVTSGHSLWLTLVDKNSGGGVQRVGFYP
jgi:streptogramin lyase